MPLSVGELVQIPHLTLRVHAGASGLERRIVWTHTTDLPEPWRWVSHGDLMMTNGMSFPSAEEEQIEVLERLAQVGISALAIGEQMHCPPLTAGFDAAADRLGVPVLWIRYPMPFAAISRTVAESNQPEQAQRITRTARIYEAIRRTPGTGVDRSRTRETLASVLQCRVDVCDSFTGWAYYPRDESPPAEVTSAIRSRAGLLTSGNRVVPLEDGGAVHIVPVPTRESASLAVTGTTGFLPDTTLLQHAATVTALELSHTHLELENRRRTCAVHAAAVLDGNSQAPAAARALAELGLRATRTLVVAATGQDEQRLLDLHVGLWRRQIEHATTVRAGVTFVILPRGTHALRAVSETLGRSAVLGASRPVLRDARFAEAAQEAAWAVGMARRSAMALVRYGETSPSLGPTDREDARALVEHRLGELLRYDAEHDGTLVATLESFLEHRRSWQRTAEALQIHRQTVHYRVRRIEELIDVDLAESGDLAQVWFALQARRSLEGMP
jgi:purine catabolism regulator